MAGFTSIGLGAFIAIGACGCIKFVDTPDAAFTCVGGAHVAVIAVQGLCARLARAVVTAVADGAGIGIVAISQRWLVDTANLAVALVGGTVVIVVAAERGRAGLARAISAIVTHGAFVVVVTQLVVAVVLAAVDRVAKIGGADVAIITYHAARTSAAASITTGTKTFLIKAVDTTGNYSTTAGSTSFVVTAPAWVLTGGGAQTVSHVINDGQLTVTWPVPSTTQFAVASYEVRYIVGDSSTNWAGATATGHGTTEGVHSATNSITFPVTWGPGEEGDGEAHRTFIIKAKDTVGNLSSNEIYKAIQISPPDTVNAAHQFTANDEGTKVDARVFWTATTISASQLPIAHYKIFYQDYKTGSTAPTFANRGSAYLEGLGTTEFKQEVDWGPSKTNSNGTISSSTGTSNDIRRYWVVPVDLAGNWGVAYVGPPENDHIGDIEDVTVTRPNSITGLATTDYSTKSSNGVVEINWNLPVVTTAPITSIRVFWELPTWVSATSLLTSTRGEKNSKAGTATKYSTPVNWGPTNGSGETSRVIYFIAYDSIGNISVPTGITVSVNNPAQISSTALTSQVIDNNVILRWTDPAATSLPISSYDVYRCPAAGTCSVSDYLTTTTYVTNVGGTNTYSFFETAAGTYKYFVRTKDLAGNYSIPQAISTTVSEPRDFAVLTDVTSKYNTGALTAA